MKGSGISCFSWMSNCTLILLHWSLVGHINILLFISVWYVVCKPFDSKWYFTKSINLLSITLLQTCRLGVLHSSLNLGRNFNVLEKRRKHVLKMPLVFTKYVQINIIGIHAPWGHPGYDRPKARSSLVIKYQRWLPLLGASSVTTENSIALLLQFSLCPFELTHAQ